MFKVNLKGVSMDSFFLLEKGDYAFQIVEVEEGKSKSSGNDMVTVTLRERNSQAEIKDYIVVEGDNLSKLKKFLCEIGQPYDEDNLEIDPKEWVGLWVCANIIVEDYTRRDGTASKSNKIRYYFAYVENKNIAQAKAVGVMSSIPDTEEDVPF